MGFLNKRSSKKGKEVIPIVKTRKILSAIDIEIPHKDFNDFLYVQTKNEDSKFRGIKKGDEFEFGIVTLTSEITENHVFKRILDNSNEKIESVDFLLGTIAHYLEEVSKYKIGNVLAIKKSDNDFGFDLEKIKERISITKKNKIP